MLGVLVHMHNRERTVFKVGEIMETPPGPSMKELCFLPNVKKPTELWQKCVKAQDDWERQLSFVDQKVERMKEYEKKMTVELVWLTNALEDTLPKGLSKKKADEVLTEAYDNMVDDFIPCAEDPGVSQLLQHLKAFKYLCRKPKGSDSLPDLTEDMIKQSHEIMMRGLKNEQGLEINPGFYRRSPVCAGFHVYPSHDCIPTAMARIVKEYNEKVLPTTRSISIGKLASFECRDIAPFSRWEWSNQSTIVVLFAHARWPTISNSINIRPQEVTKSSGAVFKTRSRLFHLKYTPI